MREAGARAPAITVLCVDDHPIFREGLCALVESQPDMRVVAQAASGEEALAAAITHRPAVTLMDLRLAGMDGITAIARIRTDVPGARILVVSSAETEGHIVRALRAGAAGYAPKSSTRCELLAAIRIVHAGGRHLPPDVAVRAAALAADELLTERERQVLELVREGHRNKQVADRLGISESTVNFHLRNLGLKLGANDRAHAVTLAVRRGLLAV